MECLKDRNMEECSCTYEGCSRKGLCCECVRYHRAKRAIPGCFFPKDAERSYDRSIANFVKVMSQ